MNLEEQVHLCDLRGLRDQVSLLELTYFLGDTKSLKTLGQVLNTFLYTLLRAFNRFKQTQLAEEVLLELRKLLGKDNSFVDCVRVSHNRLLLLNRRAQSV